MSDSIISEGKTTAEAVENGLKQLKVSKDKVEIKVLNNPDKRSFFSILSPRVVKVELKLKENVKKEEKVLRNTEYNINVEELEKAKEYVDIFLKDFINKIDNSLKYNIEIRDSIIYVDINGKLSGKLIGYRGETLNAIQTILSSISNKNSTSKIRLILDIEKYRQKREKVLEELAEKVSKTVLKTGKSVTLDPMTAYERKIIHSKLQENTKVETYSIGENDNRRVVISKIK